MFKTGVFNVLNKTNKFFVDVKKMYFKYNKPPLRLYGPICNLPTLAFNKLYITIRIVFFKRDRMTIDFDDLI